MSKPKVTKNDDGYTVEYSDFRVEVHRDEAKNEKEAIKVADSVYQAYKDNPLKTD